MSVRSLGSLAVLTAAVSSAHAASPVSIDGTVFVDVNRNGVLDAGEPTLPGVKVFYETASSVTTDDAGHFTMTLPADGMIWARIPDGFEPTPAWKTLALKDGAQTVDLGLRPSAVTGLLNFVHASDLHLGNSVPLDEAARALNLAVQVEPRPHFLVITGDVTQDATDTSFQSLRTLVDALDVPFVSVVGNHDAYDGGLNYRKYMGPPEYCFDAGGVRFVILDFTQLGNLDQQMGFVDACAGDRGTMPLALFTHMPLDDGTSAVLADHGADYLFTGHWHSNRLIEHGPMEEVNTEAFSMGGVDFTPAGYRVVSFDGQKLHYSHRTIVDSTVLAIEWPPAEGCVPPGALKVVVAAEAGMTMGPITAALDGAAPVTLAEHGGWDQTAAMSVAAGTATDHSLVVTAPGMPPVTQHFCVAAPAAAPQVTDWTQLQGSATHLGATAVRVVPPLDELWATSVGGHLRGGSVVVAGGRVYVPVDDLADGTSGGVVALDAATGAVVWDRRLGYAVHNAPAVVGGLVVVGLANGVVRALDAATGADVWSDDLGAGLSQNYSWLYAAPTVADGVVYIGVERHFAAIDAATGRELWGVDPAPNSFWLGSYAAAGVSGGVVVAAVSRGADGLVGLDALDGSPLWNVPGPLSTAVNAGIVVDGDRAFVGNSYTNVFALDLAAPAAPEYTTWQTRLHDDADDWSYGILGTPALAAKRLYVPTMRGDVVALDEESGAELWRHAGSPGAIRPAHYRGAGLAAYAAAPVVTGDLVWVGGVDGRLSALDADTGVESFGIDLGAPIYQGAVPAGDLLLVGTFDGTVHAFVHAASSMCPDGPGCTPATGAGGGCVVAAGTHDHSWSDGIWPLAVVFLSRRRRRA